MGVSGTAVRVGVGKGVAVSAIIVAVGVVTSAVGVITGASVAAPVEEGVGD